MINKVILVGNVGNDPEVRNFDNGGMVAKISLATSESYKNRNGEKITETEWHTITFFVKLAEIVEKYVKKGDKLYIEGSIRYRSYENKEGKKVYFTEIKADKMQMLGGKKSDDLPFLK